jgi:hypothetical protein
MTKSIFWGQKKNFKKNNFFILIPRHIPSITYNKMTLIIKNKLSEFNKKKRLMFGKYLIYCSRKLRYVKIRFDQIFFIPVFHKLFFFEDNYKQNLIFF